jgi:dipeptidyl aminopeptidase/acylaminoacyl peptidase
VTHPQTVLALLLLAAAPAPHRTAVYRTAGPSARPPAAAPLRIIASAGNDASPHVSFDGEKIVFSSTRSGAWEVWRSDRDGGNVRQLTFLRDTPVGSTRWSPDGRRIAFDGQKTGHYDLYVMNEDGSGLRQLSGPPFSEIKPSWSMDGKWIYFASNRTGSFQVWKMPAAGGEAVQVTKGGGLTAFESFDGQYVYYAKGRDDANLWRIPAAGGPETHFLDSVEHNRFILTRRGICILNMQAQPHPVIEFLDFGTRRRRSLDVLPPNGKIYGGGTAIAAPPDGSWLLFCQTDPPADVAAPNP